MSRKLFISALLFVGILTFSGVAYPWGSASGDGSRAQALQETAVFFNNSGATLVAGQIVLLDKLGSGVTAATTMGSYVTTTRDADISGIVGVVKSVSAINQGPVVVITKGPADTLILDSSDPVLTSNYVGTSAEIGYGGRWTAEETTIEGTAILGQAMEDGDGTDTGKVWTWVNPTP